MITTDLIRQLPARFRSRLEREEPPDDSELMEDYELAADVAEELLRLRRWQADAATVLVVLRRHLTGQEPLDQEHLDIWRQAADALTGRRVLHEGGQWQTAEDFVR